MDGQATFAQGPDRLFLEAVPPCCAVCAGDYQPYDCPITGKTIDGRREHRENLELHGCRVHEKGEFEDVKKNGKKRIEASMDAAIDKSVDAIARQIDF